MDVDGGMTLARFCVFGPQIISGIGALHGTMMSRSFVIRMKPKRADQEIEPLRKSGKADLADTQPYAARWAADNGELLENLVAPAMPAHWSDRQKDNAEVLLLIASRGGDAMVDLLCMALDLHYTRENNAQSPTVATRLLTDLYDCLVELGQAGSNGKLHSDEIVAHLLAMEEAPWATFRRGQPLDKPTMARMLKDFGVSTQQVKRNGNNKRGMTFYQIKLAVETFAPAHLSPQTATAGATLLPSAENRGKLGSTRPVERDPETAGCYPKTPRNSSEGSTVAPSEPELGGAPEGGVADEDLDEVLL